MLHNKSMYITNVEKEGPFLKIWGQIDKKSSLEVEEALLRASERFDEGKYKLRQNSLEVGILCCAKYVDEKYYRARITSIAPLTDEMVEVNFIDYGNKDVIPVGNLRTLECFNPSFITLPPLSSPFILAEVVCIGGEWNDRIVEQISKEIRYMEHNYVIIAQAIRYYFIKVFVLDIDLGLHLVRQNLMQSTSIQTQEAVLLAMIPRTPQAIPSPNQSLLQYKSFTLEPNSQHEVYVSYITDGPCHFSVQLKKYESALAQLMREINSIPLKPLEELPIPGTVCLAKCVEDNHICRAVVTSEVDSQYKLFYVDFGNTELVPPENLYQMAFKFIIPKIMAIRLSLAGIEKTSMTLEMQCAFKQFVDNRLLMMEVQPAAKKMALPKCRMWDPDTNTDVIEVLNRAAKCAYPDPIALLKGFTQLVKVSFVYSCNRFYVQLKSKEAELNQLMKDLQIYCNSNQTSYLGIAKVGQPCCALFSFDQNWYRSLITEIDGNQAKVRYVDFGNEEYVPIDSLKVAEGEYLTILRPQAIECCLNGYQNMAEDQDRDIKLEELILEQEFTMRVIDSIESKTLVDLMDACNTTVTALLLESIMAQTKVQTAVTVPETNRSESGGKRQGAAEEWRGGDERSTKPYFQHDDRRSPRGQNWKEKTDGNTSWRQHSRKRSDSNSNESTESWRQDNRGFKNRKENDWNDRPSTNNSFKDRAFRGRSENAENERPSRNSNRYSDGNYWNNKRGSRNQNVEFGGEKEAWNQSRPPRHTNGEWSDGNSRGDKPWKDNQGFKKKYERDNEWGKNDNGDSKGRNNDWNNRSEKGDWNNKTEKGDWNNRNEKSQWNNKNETSDWNNKNSGGGGDWSERKTYKDKNSDWNSNKGGSERKFGDRRENDRGDFKKKPFRREASELSSSGSEKSFGRGLHTSSRNDNRPPRSDRKFGQKSSDNSWNVSAVPSVIDSAPNDAKFKSVDVSGRQEKVTISWFHNPCSFFCQLVESQEAFKQLMEEIQQAYKGRPPGTCVKGAPAIALFPEDNVLYRARIMDVLGAQCKVHYVDFGNVSLVDKVWPIENKFMEMPMQAIPCGLTALEPVGDNWPNPDNFSEYFEREALDCGFSSCDENGRYWVQLSVDNEDVTQKLVDNALAKYSESTIENVEIALLIGQQFRAMLHLVNGCSDFTLVLQSGFTVHCSMHNLATATEINEDLLKQHLEQILIVYVDDLVEDRLEVTLYDSTGTKLNIIEPDEGAFDTVEPLCPYLVTSSTLRGFVSHVEDASVVIQPSECAQNIEFLLEQLFEYYDNMPPADAPLIPEEGSVYAVKSNDGNWYRGRVTTFDDANAKVTYLDYGNCEDVEFSRLRDVTPELTMWDAMAILINVKVPTGDLLEQDVIATIYYGEAGWEGEIQLAEAPELPVPQQSEPEVEHTIESEQVPELSSVQFNETSPADIAQETTETIQCQSDETTEISPAGEETVSSGVESDNVRPDGGTPVVLSHVDSPSDFYIQLVDSLASIDELQLRLQNAVGEMTQLESASVGGLCAAPYSVDQQWYRSQILDADDDITTVRFIDYGNTDVIDNNATQIKTLPAEFLSLEEYATRCRLKIKPSEEEWPKAAVERFEQLTAVKNLTVEFVDQDEKTNYVELYSDGTNVKDILIAENLAILDDVVLEGKLTGFVSHMNSPSEFWVQLESCCAELEWIAEQLSNAVSFQDLEDLTPGSLCAAMFQDDEMWYRARILSNTVAGLEVLFLDYGNSCVCSNLKQLPEHLVMAPPLAQKCSLQRPEGVTSWSPEASQRFSELSADGQTIFTVKKLTTGETSIVELLMNGEEVSSKLLIDNGYVTDMDLPETTAKEVAVSEVVEKLQDELLKETDKEECEVVDNKEKEIVPEISVEEKEIELTTESKEIELTAESKEIELTADSKENEVNLDQIEHNKSDEIEEVHQKKSDEDLEKIPTGDCKIAPSEEKFEDAENKGKPHQDVEYLSDNTVRLYLDETKINNKLKELLSPILKEKNPHPVSVIATIEIISEDIRQNEEFNENPVETSESRNEDFESSSQSEITTVDSENHNDKTIQMIESLVDDIVNDVRSNTSLNSENEEISILTKNHSNEFESSENTDFFDLDSSEQPTGNDKLTHSMGDLSKQAEDVDPLESLGQDKNSTFATVPDEEVILSKQEYSETNESIDNSFIDQEIPGIDSKLSEMTCYDSETEKNEVISPIISNGTNDAMSSNELVSELHNSESVTQTISSITHTDQFVICEDEVSHVSIEDKIDIVSEQTDNGFVTTEVKIMKTETDTGHATIQLEVDDANSNLTAEERLNYSVVEEQGAEIVDEESEMIAREDSNTNEIDTTTLDRIQHEQTVKTDNAAIEQEIDDEIINVVEEQMNDCVVEQTAEVVDEESEMIEKEVSNTTQIDTTTLNINLEEQIEKTETYSGDARVQLGFDDDNSNLIAKNRICDCDIEQTAELVVEGASKISNTTQTDTAILDRIHQGQTMTIETDRDNATTQLEIVGEDSNLVAEKRISDCDIEEQRAEVVVDGESEIIDKEISETTEIDTTALNHIQQEENMKTETYTDNATIKLEIDDKNSSLIANEQISDSDIGEQITEVVVEGKSEMINREISNKTEIDTTVKNKDCDTKNNDDSDVPNVEQSKEIKFDAETYREDGTLTGEVLLKSQEIERESKGNSQISVLNPEVELTQSDLTIPETIVSIEQEVTEALPVIEQSEIARKAQTDVNSVQYAGQSEDQSVRHNVQNEESAQRTNLEVACEYLELHEMKDEQGLSEHSKENSDISTTVCSEQESEKHESNIVDNTSELSSTVSSESEVNLGVCSDSKKCDVSQKISSVINLKTKEDKSCDKVEFQDKILTSFSAPTISECRDKVTMKLSPTKIAPKSHTVSEENLRIENGSESM